MIIMDNQNFLDFKTAARNGQPILAMRRLVDLLDELQEELAELRALMPAETPAPVKPAVQRKSKAEADVDSDGV